MKRLIFFVLFFIFAPTLLFGLDLTPEEKRKIERDVGHSFDEIISLWRTGKFEDLYEYGYLSNHINISKESFVRRMKNKSYVIATSWEAVRDVEINIVGRRDVYARVKIGYKNKLGGDTLFFTETFKMLFEGDKWRVDLFKLLLSPI